LRQVATAYQSFYEEFPKSENADKALFNASVAWDKVGEKQQANRLREKLVKEFGLLLQAQTKPLPGVNDGEVSFEKKEAAMVKALETVGPGTYMLVMHPAVDDPEMRSVGHIGYTTVAAQRDSTTRALTSKRVLAVVKKRGIKLVSYGDLKAEAAR
jgi:aromatic ring-cleaving dioxygenase